MRYPPKYAGKKAPGSYYQTKTIQEYGLQDKDSNYFILFQEKYDGQMRVACFWGYDEQWELRLTKAEAREVYQIALNEGFVKR